MKVIMIYGSANDMAFMDIGKDYLKEQDIAFDEKVLSAHRDLPELLEYIDELNKSDEKMVILAIAGLSAAPAWRGCCEDRNSGCRRSCSWRARSTGSTRFWQSVRFQGKFPLGTVGLHKKAPLNACMFAHRILKNSSADVSDGGQKSRVILSETDIAS